MRDQIRAEASEWMLRLEEDGGAVARAGFSEWLTRSPEHVEAFLAVSLASRALGQVSGDAFDTEALIAAARAEDEEDAGNVVILPRGVVPPVAASVRLSPRRLIAAAACVLVVAAIGWAGVREALAPEHYVTAGNETRAVTLADGSVVELDRDSAVYLHWTKAERRIELRKGAGRFTVAKNPDRPFIVATAVTSVRAVGTVFSVKAQPGDTVVSVSEGRVKVEPSYGDTAAAKAIDEPPVQLAAGDRAVVSHRARHDVSVTAWADQRLVFRGAALGAVIDEFNQRAPAKLVLADNSLADLAISGVFDPSDVESFLKYLERYEGVRMGRQPDGSVRMSAGTRPIK